MNQTLCSMLHSEVPSQSHSQMGELGVQKYNRVMTSVEVV